MAEIRRVAPQGSMQYLACSGATMRHALVACSGTAEKHAFLGMQRCRSGAVMQHAILSCSGTVRQHAIRHAAAPHRGMHYLACSGAAVQHARAMPSMQQHRKRHAIFYMPRGRSAACGCWHAAAPQGSTRLLACSATATHLPRLVE